VEGKALTRVEGADWELPNTGDGTEDGMADVDESSVEDHADCAPASPLGLLLAMLENPKTALSCGRFSETAGQSGPRECRVRDAGGNKTLQTVGAAHCTHTHTHTHT